MKLRRRLFSVMLTLVMIAGMMPAGVSFAGSYDDTYSFSDISGHWARYDILDAVDRGMFSGVSESRFAPNRPMTRAMFVTALYRADDGIAEENSDFYDVSDSDSWYYDAVCWASENNIVNGTDKRHFSPNNNVTREQMAAILYRYLDYLGAGLKGGSGASVVFSDGSSISSFAKDPIQKLQSANVINGKPDGYGRYRFDPKGRATRAEVAHVFCAFFDKLEYGEEIDVNDVQESLSYAQSTFEDAEFDYMDDDFLILEKDLSKALAADKKVAEKMKSEGIITKYEVNDDNIVVWLKSGAAYIHQPDVKEYQELASEATGVKTYEPYRGQDDNFIKAQKKHGSITDLAKKIQSADSRYSYNVDCGASQATVESMKRWTGESIIIWLGHGAYTKSIGECLSTGEYLNDENSRRLAEDYYADRVVLTDDNRFMVTSKFFDHYYNSGSLTGSLIWLGGCSTDRDTRMCDVLRSKGASTVLGSSWKITIPYLVSMTNHFFTRLTETDKSTGTYYTADKALQYAKDKAFPLTDSFFFAEMKLEGNGNFKLGGTKASITGTVGNSLTKKPISGAKIYVEGTQRYAVTGDDGTYTLTDVQPNQTVNIRAEADGYISQSTSTLVGPTKGTASFSLKSNAGRIKLRPEAESGASLITRGTYSVYKITGTKKETVYNTKAFSGTPFYITELEVGAEYNVEISVDGYKTVSATTKAMKDPTEINMKLVKKDVAQLEPVGRTIQVSVADEDTGEAVSGADVTVYGKSSDTGSYTEITSGKSDSSGKFSAKISGSYSKIKAEASKTGYVRASTEMSSSGLKQITVKMPKEKDLSPDTDKNTETGIPEGYTPIYTADDLRALYDVQMDSDVKYILMNDIDGKDVIAPSYWHGVLDGNGHTITDPHINGIIGEYTGWMCMNYGTVKNLRFRNVSFKFEGDKNKYYIGTIAGINYGTIENCVVESGSISNTSTSMPEAGGIVGYNAPEGVIKNCVNKASVSVYSTVGKQNLATNAIAGGIASHNSGKIYHCLNTGDIFASAPNFVTAAGIAEYEAAIDKDPPVISDCGNCGRVSGYRTQTIGSGDRTLLSVGRGLKDSSYATDSFGQINVKEMSSSEILKMWSDIL